MICLNCKDRIRGANKHKYDRVWYHKVCSRDLAKRRRKKLLKRKIKEMLDLEIIGFYDQTRVITGP
jgi:isopentenyldiphosphate isomerase